MAGYSSSEATAQRWERLRQQGRKSYIIKYGILGWGIPVALAVTGLDWYHGTPAIDLAVPLAIRLVLFGILGGLAFGASMWKFNEYLRNRAHKSAT